MDAVIQAFIAGFPVLILHSAITIAMLIAGVFIYVKITPHDEIKLIRDGNCAAATSLAGAIVGLALPLAFCMANSVNFFEIIVWGPVTLALQLIAYRVTDAVMSELPTRIDKGEMAAAIFLVAIKIAVALINAAAVAG